MRGRRGIQPQPPCLAWRRTTPALGAHWCTDEFALASNIISLSLTAQIPLETEPSTTSSPDTVEPQAPAHPFDAVSNPPAWARNYVGGGAVAAPGAAMPPEASEAYVQNRLEDIRKCKPPPPT